MDPLLLTFLRASIAGLLAIALLVGFRQKRPRLAQLVSLIIVSSGVVLGFPLLTALALQRITSAHSIVFIGLLPLMTALFGVLRGGERPRRAFWIFFAAGQPAGGGIRPDAKCGGLTQRRSADAGGGYRLRPRLCGRGEADAGARRLAGDLLGAGDCPAVDAPRLAAGSARLPGMPSRPPPRAALGYVSLFSMLIGFIFLVQRAGRGRDRRRRPAPAIAAVLRTRPVGGAVARNRQPLDAGGHAGRGAVRGGLAQICPPAGWRRERGQQLT